MPCEEKLCLGGEKGQEDCVLGAGSPGSRAPQPETVERSLSVITKDWEEWTGCSKGLQACRSFCQTNGDRFWLCRGILKCFKILKVCDVAPVPPRSTPQRRFPKRCEAYRIRSPVREAGPNGLPCSGVLRETGRCRLRKMFPRRSTRFVQHFSPRTQEMQPETGLKLAQIHDIHREHNKTQFDSSCFFSPRFHKKIDRNSSCRSLSRAEGTRLRSLRLGLLGFGCRAAGVLLYS